MKPCKHADYRPNCRICWLNVNDSRYTKLWGTNGAVPTNNKCIYLGTDTGEQVLCAEGCRGTKLKVFNCAVYGACTIAKRGDGISACCKGCPKFTTEIQPNQTLREAGVSWQESAPFPQIPKTGPLEWAYGVTTVPQRLEDGTLHRTLSSLRLAGFDRPRLFVDGDVPNAEWSSLGCDMTYRYPNVRTFGNWVMGMWELYLRQPQADRYAIFQDDCVAYHNLRSYLDQSPYPKDGYLNLYTMPSNQTIAPATTNGWYRALFMQCVKCNKRQHLTGVQQTGMCCGERQFQYGRGAVGLVFDRRALQALLASDHMAQRPTDPMRGHRAIDGGISWSMNKSGFFEYVHTPSLVQHIGKVSAMGNAPHPLAASFKGEDFDARELVVK